MILTESRMRENRTSGLMSGGEETQRGTRLRHRQVAKAAGNSDSLDLRPARLPLDSTEEPRRATKALRLTAAGCHGHEGFISI